MKVVHQISDDGSEEWSAEIWSELLFEAVGVISTSGHAALLAERFPPQRSFEACCVVNVLDTFCAKLLRMPVKSLEAARAAIKSLEIAADSLRWELEQRNIPERLSLSCNTAGII